MQQRWEMNAYEALAEQRIREAQERGEFDDLPGAGAPLELDDDSLVPEELRAAYRVLKNAGYVPPEVEALRDLRALEQAICDAESASERERLVARMSALIMRTPMGRRRGDLRIEARYFARVAEKLGRSRGGRR